MEFAYEATDADGSLITGYLDADNEDAAASHVRSRGLVPLKLVASDGQSLQDPTDHLTSPDQVYSEMELSDDDRPFPVAESNVTTAHLDANPGFSDQLGPTPPPAPRTIAGVGPRYPFKGPLISFAAIWSAISVPMFLLFLFNGQILGALFLSGFVAIGWYSGRLAWKPALARMKAWEAGVATPAIVRSTGRANYAVDGRSPFKLDYAFEVDGVVHEGSRITFDSEITRYEEGQPMWVVHLPEDPSISAEWPPIV